MPKPNPAIDPKFSLDDQQEPTRSDVAIGSTPPKPARKKAGIFIPLTADGAIDMTRATPQQIAVLQSASGIVEKKESEKKPRPKINLKYVAQGYSILEIIIQQVGKLLLKWPKELASEMHFSEDKKKALVEPTAELVDLYAPNWLLDNQAMAAFAAAFGDAINDMVQRGSERYVIKILRGECPPPPGFKFPPIQVARPQAPASPAPPPHVEVPPPSSPPTANPDNGRGFMPHVPSGTGIV